MKLGHSNKFRKEKIKVKLYLAGNQFAATAKSDFIFVDKCYADTPELAKEMALNKLNQLTNRGMREII